MNPDTWISLRGDEEDRTLDLTDANRTLSQLSYAPTTLAIIPQRGRDFNCYFKAIAYLF